MRLYDWVMTDILRKCAVGLGLLLGVAACDTTVPPATAAKTWKILAQEDDLTKLGDSLKPTKVSLEGAIFSIWGSNADDMWVVGGNNSTTAANNKPPIIMHWSGNGWSSLADPSFIGTMWWVTGIGNSDIWMAGTGGNILHTDRKANKSYLYSPALKTVPTSEQLYGIIAFSNTDVWAVGGPSTCGATCGVIWHLDDSGLWKPSTAPSDMVSSATWFKVWGRSSKDLYVCGSAPTDNSNNKILHFDGTTWTAQDSGVDVNLFTCDGNDKLVVCVGGASSGAIVENDGTGWKRIKVAGLEQMNGVAVPKDPACDPIAVGLGGAVWRRTSGVWTRDSGRPDIGNDYHGAFLDDKCNAWAVGGQILSAPTKAATISHFGETHPAPPNPATK